MYVVPPKSKFVTYYRVSTQKQGISGLGLEAQRAQVSAYLSQVSGVELASYTEVESGKLDARPQLEAALLRCRQTRATLLVAKLDRLSRNGAFLYRLRDSGMRFQALDIPDANTLTLGVIIAMAQHERERISERTKDALAARKARGLRLGTPRDMTPHAARGSALGSAVLHAQALARAQDISPAIEAARAQGCTTQRQIAEHLNSQSITTACGKPWTQVAVLRTLRLLAL
jgi:DNA invertase Pin-like site-specific DNA recombinase